MKNIPVPDTLHMNVAVQNEMLCTCMYMYIVHCALFAWSGANKTNANILWCNIDHGARYIHSITNGANISKMDQLLFMTGMPNASLSSVEDQLELLLHLARGELST
jgi:hypothetical protein